VKYVWSYIYTPPIRLHGMVLSEKKKHRDNFTFTFYLDRDQWQALVNTVMNLCVLQKTGNFLTSWETISFSWRTQLHRVSYRLDIDYLITLY